MNYTAQGFIDELESRGCSYDQSLGFLKKAQSHPELGNVFQGSPANDSTIAIKTALAEQLEVEKTFEE